VPLDHRAEVERRVEARIQELPHIGIGSVLNVVWVIADVANLELRIAAHSTQEIMGSKACPRQLSQDLNLGPLDQIKQSSCMLTTLLPENARSLIVISTNPMGCPQMQTGIGLIELR
jgi:hypothetical protein